MNYKKYSDKYFVRSREILEKEGLNPVVEMQVFIRKGPGKVYGLDEATRYIKENSDIGEVGGQIYTLMESSNYDSNEVVMKIVAPIQSIIELETQYLGIISAETTKANDGGVLLPNAIKENVKKVVDLVNGRPVFYFGARHWRYDADAAISKAAFDGGVVDCSTDAGAEAVGKKGIGTIPHALVIAFASKYGRENATLEATKAFDKWMDKGIKRIALVDTFNREITDSLMVARNIKNLYGIRLDTCGENLGEGCSDDEVDLGDKIISGGVKGVTKVLAYGVRSALDKNGFKNIKIILSSGFAKAEKVRDFVEAEQFWNIKLFDGLGCGQFFHSRTATADIVKVDGQLLSKTGRGYKENERLVRRL